MTRWGFFRFALSISAIILGIAFGIYFGKTTQNNESNKNIILQIEVNNAIDNEIRQKFNIDKSAIIKRLQKHSYIK